MTTPNREQSARRAAALRTYGIMDTPPEAAFNRFADLAVHTFDAPIALVSFIDEDREWIKAQRNFDRSEVPVKASLGINVLSAGTPLVVEDTREDIRFATNPLVTDQPGIRFYAGAPLVTPDETPIGTIAVMDTETRRLSGDEASQLSTLAALIMETVEAQFPPALEATDLLPTLRSSESSTVLLDESGAIVESGDTWERIAPPPDEVGQSPSGAEQANYLDLLTASLAHSEEDRAEQIRDGVEAILRGDQQTFEAVFPLRHADQTRWFHTRAMLLDHPSARAVVTHQNVTDLKHHRRRRRVLETAVEQAREVVLITEGTPLDKPGPRITYVNPAFTDVTGYSPDEVIGKTPRLLQGPDTEPWVIDDMREQLEKGEPFSGEAINYRKDGTPYVNQWSIAPVHDNEGTLTHWVSVQRDVSQERQMEKRLLWAQENERHRIARTMHDEMGGLLATLQMAVASSGSADSDASGLIGEVRAVVNELSEVVRDLTERLHSRVLEDYGLSRALPRLADQFRDPDGLDVDLHNELSDDDSLPSLLEKIAYRGVFEALTNVEQHAEADSVQILVNQEDKKIRIHVIDDGVGFAPATELNADDQHGLIGLKERVVRLNGKLEIDSAPTAGTRISMTLPITLVSLLERTDPSSSS